MARLEEMERLLREAQVEKNRLLEHKVQNDVFVFTVITLSIPVWWLCIFSCKENPKHFIFPKVYAYVCVCVVYLFEIYFFGGGVCIVFQEREMEMRKQALEEERRRREDLEKRLQEETSRRQKLIDREVKLREKQRAQVIYKYKEACVEIENTRFK